MPKPTVSTLRIRIALCLGVLVPILYCGVQAIAAPAYPDFSLYRVTASELGSDRSPRAAVFNAGLFVLGAGTIVASVGFFSALRRLGVHVVLAATVSMALGLNGVQTLWAAWFPMPHPRHGGHPVFIIAMLSLPVLLAASMWFATTNRAVRAYFLLHLVGLAVVAPFMSGATSLDLNEYRGLLQRIFALTIFVPICAASWVLWRQVGESCNAKRG